MKLVDRDTGVPNAAKAFSDGIIRAQVLSSFDLLSREQGASFRSILHAKHSVYELLEQARTLSRAGRRIVPVGRPISSLQLEDHSDFIYTTSIEANGAFIWRKRREVGNQLLNDASALTINYVSRRGREQLTVSVGDEYNPRQRYTLTVEQPGLFDKGGVRFEQLRRAPARIAVAAFA